MGSNPLTFFSRLALAFALAFALATPHCNGIAGIAGGRRLSSEIALERFPAHGGGKLSTGRDALKRIVMNKGKRGLPSALAQDLPGHTGQQVQQVVGRTLATWTVFFGFMVFLATRPGTTIGAIELALFWSVMATGSLQGISNVLTAVAKNGVLIGQDIAYMVGLNKLRWTYLSACCVCTVAEFLPLPYLYPLIKGMGYSDGSLLKLVVLAQLSSMVSGIFVGGLLDKYGRRKGCVAYAALTALHCVMVRTRDIRVIILSRVVAGVSSNLLATSMECWLVAETTKRGLPPLTLPQTFGLATSVSSVTMVLSGLLGDQVSKHGWGDTAAFDVAALVSVCVGTLFVLSFTENHGDQKHSWAHHMKEAIDAIGRDKRLLLMVLYQGLFEGAMSVWLTLWQPMLHNGEISNFSHGRAFAAMLASCCAGACLFKILTEDVPESVRVSAEWLLFPTSASACLLLGAASSRRMSTAKRMVCFLLYEVCLGVHLPAMSTCRSRYIGNSIRSTVTNIFRVPVSLVPLSVIFGSWFVGTGTVDFPGTLGICSLLLGIATLVQSLFLKRTTGSWPVTLHLGGCNGGQEPYCQGKDKEEPISLLTRAEEIFQGAQVSNWKDSVDASPDDGENRGVMSGKFVL